MRRHRVTVTETDDGVYTADCQDCPWQRNGDNSHAIRQASSHRSGNIVYEQEAA